MSMPSYNLTCNKCDYSVSSMILWGGFLYTDGETEFSCNKSMGWCDDCSAIAPIENFENTGRELEIIEQRSQWLRNENGTFRKALLNLLFSSRRKHQQSCLNDIYSASKTISLSRKRRGTECCLYCGGRSVHFFNGDAKLGFSSDMKYTESHPSGFIHPHCGGEFVSKPNSMRFNVITRTRLYSVDGKLISEL